MSASEVTQLCNPAPPQFFAAGVAFGSLELYRPWESDLLKCQYHYSMYSRNLYGNGVSGIVERHVLFLTGSLCAAKR